MYRNVRHLKRGMLLSTAKNGLVECPCCSGISCQQCDNGFMALADAINHPKYKAINGTDRAAWRMYKQDQAGALCQRPC